MRCIGILSVGMVVSLAALIIMGTLLTVLSLFFPVDSAVLVPWLALPALPVGVAGAKAAAESFLKPAKAWRKNRCHECTYNLTGNVSGVCPECGTKIEAE